MKLFLQLLTVLIVTTFTSNFYLSTVSKQQSDYVDWMETVVPVLARSSSKRLPNIEIKLQSSIPNYSGNWSLQVIDGITDNATKDNTLRILELTAASKLFSYRTNDKKTKGIKRALQVTISNDDYYFKASATQNQIADNISLQTLIQLMSHYAISKGKEPETLANKENQNENT